MRYCGLLVAVGLVICISSLVVLGLPLPGDTDTLVSADQSGSPPPLTINIREAPRPTVIPTEEPYVSDLPNLGQAPELENEIWLNTDEPLRLENLRGHVVLLHMWTFGCINCINTLPHVRQWHKNYAEDGLVIIGNHYPEFDFERSLDNLRDAIARLDVRWAVAQDNDRQTWGAYHNRYWPTIYLIDKWGNIRYKHIGEGAYDVTDDAIKDLLAETYTPVEDTAQAESN